MAHLVVGIAVILFGLLVGGVGVASAGIGIGIPMIPLGIYLTIRGWRIYHHEKEQEESDVINPMPLEPLEKTKWGKILLGILLVIVGAGASAFLVGIPILAYGIWIIYSGFGLRRGGV